MRASIGFVAALLSAMAVATSAAGNEEAGGVARNRDDSPIFVETPIVLAQAADTTTQSNYLLKTCDEVPSAGGAVTAMNMIDSAAWLVSTVLTKNGRQVSAEEFEALKAIVKLTQLQGVTHGQLIPHSPNGRVFYEYRSEPGYVGKDQAIFMAEFEGKRYKIIANVVVSMSVNENSPQCPPPQLIPVSKPSSGASGFGAG